MIGGFSRLYSISLQNIYYLGPYVTYDIGDVILADRGFNCNEYVRMVLAEAKTPPLLKERTN